jgi:hypothetical protein
MLVVNTVPPEARFPLLAQAAAADPARADAALQERRRAEAALEERIRALEHIRALNARRREQARDRGARPRACLPQAFIGGVAWAILLGCCPCPVCQARVTSLWRSPGGLQAGARHPGAGCCGADPPMHAFAACFVRHLSERQGAPCARARNVAGHGQAPEQASPVHCGLVYQVCMPARKPSPCHALTHWHLHMSARAQAGASAWIRRHRSRRRPTVALPRCARRGQAL